MISYNKFWHWCLDNKVSKTYLHDELEISWPTISKMRENEYVKIQVLEKICNHFNLGFDDIMEIVKNS